MISVSVFGHHCNYKSRQQYFNWGERETELLFTPNNVNY